MSNTHHYIGQDGQNLRSSWGNVGTLTKYQGKSGKPRIGYIRTPTTCILYLFVDNLLLINSRSVFLTPLCAMQAEIRSRKLDDRGICHALLTAQDRVRSQVNAGRILSVQNGTGPGLFRVFRVRVSLLFHQFGLVWFGSFGVFVHPFSHTCNTGRVKFTHPSPTLHNLRK